VISCQNLTHNYLVNEENEREDRERELGPTLTSFPFILNNNKICHSFLYLLFINQTKDELSRD